MEVLFEHGLLQHRRLFAELEGLRPLLCDAAVLMAEALHRGGRVLFCGNGGSAFDSQHLATEFNGRLRQVRARRAAVALHVESHTANVVGSDREDVFARQLSVLGRPGDCPVTLSTSGDSANVLRALAAGRASGLTSVALLGRDGGRARALADVAVVVPHADRARVQEAHLFIGHTWCGQIESALSAL